MSIDVDLDSGVDVLLLRVTELSFFFKDSSSDATY